MTIPVVRVCKKVYIAPTAYEALVKVARSCTQAAGPIPGPSPATTAAPPAPSTTEAAATTTSSTSTPAPSTTTAAATTTSSTTTTALPDTSTTAKPTTVKPETQAKDKPAASVSGGAVVVYGYSSSYWCRKTRAELKKAGVSYQWKDTRLSKVNDEEMWSVLKRSGHTKTTVSVPVVRICDSVYQGPRNYKQLVEAAKVCSQSGTPKPSPKKEQKKKPAPSPATTTKPVVPEKKPPHKLASAGTVSVYGYESSAKCKATRAALIKAGLPFEWKDTKLKKANNVEMSDILRSIDHQGSTVEVPVVRICKKVYVAPTNNEQIVAEASACVVAGVDLPKTKPKPKPPPRQTKAKPKPTQAAYRRRRRYSPTGGTTRRRRYTR